MKRGFSLVLAFILVIFTLMIGVSTPPAVAGTVCPDGGGWTKINSGDLSSYPVDGATKYCFKAGNWPTVGSIPSGGFGQDCPCTDDIKCCGLSNWSYFIPEPSPTPTEPPDTPTPTDTPEEPTPTPTDTPEEPTPTPTDTPEGPTPTPTDTPTEPTPTPTKTDRPRKTPTLPYTGLVLYEMDEPETVSSYLIIPEIGVHTSIRMAPYTDYMGWDIGGIGDVPTILEGTHAIAGHVKGVFYDLYLLEPGDQIFVDGIPYVMREQRFVSPFDMDVLSEGDLVLFTCSWWTGTTYRYRRVIIADALTQ